MTRTHVAGVENQVARMSSFTRPSMEPFSAHPYVYIHRPQDADAETEDRWLSFSCGVCVLCSSWCTSFCLLSVLRRTVPRVLWERQLCSNECSTCRAPFLCSVPIGTSVQICDQEAPKWLQQLFCMFSFDYGQEIVDCGACCAALLLCHQDIFQGGNEEARLHGCSSCFFSACSFSIF